MINENNKSSLEIRIQRFVNQYGAEQLIEWIDEFEFFGGAKKFKQFKKLEKTTCEEFGLTIADMHRMSTSDCTDSKRIISFIAFNKIQLPQLVIAKLLGSVSIRSVYYYIRDTEEWIDDPKKNRGFAESYNRVYEKFITANSN